MTKKYERFTKEDWMDIQYWSCDTYTSYKEYKSEILSKILEKRGYNHDNLACDDLYAFIHKNCDALKSGICGLF